MLADPTKHPLAPLLRRIPVADKNLLFSMAAFAAALILSPVTLGLFGWWIGPLYILILFGFVTHGIFLIAAPSTGKLRLAVYRCRKCGYRWVKRESPPETYLRRMEWELNKVRKGKSNAYLAAVLSDTGAMRLMYRGDIAGALPLLEESLTQRRTSNDRRGLAYTLDNLGFALIFAGRPGEARPYCEESLSIFRDLKEWRGVAAAANSLAIVLLAQGEYEHAASLLNESLAIKWRMADEELIAWGLEDLAQVAALRRDWLRAARLLACAQRLRETTGISRPPATQLGLQSALDAVRSDLSPTAFANAWAEGRHMTTDQACDYALNSRDVVPISLPAYSFS